MTQRGGMRESFLQKYPSALHINTALTACEEQPVHQNAIVYPYNPLVLLVHCRWTRMISVSSLTRFPPCEELCLLLQPLSRSQQRQQFVVHVWSLHWGHLFPHNFGKSRHLMSWEYFSWGPSWTEYHVMLVMSWDGWTCISEIAPFDKDIMGNLLKTDVEIFGFKKMN